MTDGRSAQLDPPLRRFPGSSDIKAELVSQIALLEAMFDDRGLVALRTRHPHHPAVRRYDNLVAGLEVSPDEDVERRRVQDLAQGLVDRATWADDPSVRPFWPTTIPDVSQALHIQRTIDDPEQYDDATLELFVWGAVRLAGIAAELQERDGEPDVRLPGPPQPGWLEVKRIHLGAVPHRARRVLSKASRQIRKVSPDEPGTAYVFIETAGETAAFDDAIPSEVDQYVAEIQRTLGSSDDNHVGRVIVGWDDFMVLGHSPDPTLYAVRRRAMVLKRVSAVTTSRAIDWLRVFGFTTTMWLRPTGPAAGRPKPIVTPTLVVGDLFHDRNNWPGGIRVAHARRVLASPDGVVEVPMAGGDMKAVMVTKRVDATGVSHVILLIGYRRKDGPLTLTDGFRLQGTETELHTYATDPETAFHELLRRFGLPVSIDSGQGQLFHLQVVAKAPLTLSVLDAGNGPFAIAAFIRSSLGLFEATWVYALDDAAYRASYRP